MTEPKDKTHAELIATQPPRTFTLKDDTCLSGKRRSRDPWPTAFPPKVIWWEA